MRKTGIRRGVFVGLGLLATASLAACSAHGAPVSARPGNGQKASAAARSAATTQATSPPAVAASAAPSAAGGVENLIISSAEKTELTAVFVTMMGVPAADVVGPYPGDTYYAYDPATDTYWAMSTFEESSSAPPSVIALCQEYGQTALFEKAAAGSWQVERISASGSYCLVAQFFPPAVLTAWALPTTPPAGQTC
jgi:hypothetical protein